jgi:hypothetical protein
MDLAFIEANGNGGDLQIRGNDVFMIEGWGNMPYLGMFGGNVEAVTRERFAGEQAFDWWGNNLLLPQDQSKQFNSVLEKALMEVSLTSNGRVQIQKKVLEDLAFMKVFAELAVEVEFENIDRVKIVIKVKQPATVQGRIPDAYRAYIFIWDGTRQLLGDFSILDFNGDFFV